MIPLNIWEHQNAIKTLYSKCVSRVCDKHHLTRMELDILLFLANNPQHDTATDIVGIRYLSKSQVSSSIKLLEGKGFLRKEYASHNRKTAHLKICPKAAGIICDGQAAQKQFLSVMIQGFSQEEFDTIRRYNERIRSNIDSYLKEQEQPDRDYD